MKTKLALPLIGLYCMTSAHGATILLAGYDGNNALGSPLQSAAASGVAFNVTWNETITGFNVVGGQQNASILWGTTDLDVDASDANNNGIAYMDTVTVTMTMTITNGSTSAIALDTLHWRTKRDGNNSATTATITYTGGDLTAGAGNGLAYNLGGLSTIGHDVDLVTTNNILATNVLGIGQSATFTWATSGGTGQRLRIDNLAFSGEAIPEPSTALLGAIGLLALLRRRR